MSERAALLSEAEIDFLATCTPGEWCRIATQDWSMLASVIATARAYHRLRGLVEAIGRGEAIDRYDCLRVLAEVDSSERA